MKKIHTSIFIFLMPGLLLAYIDPGTGSAIMTAIIGFFVAIGLMIKTYWFRFKGLFKRESKNLNKYKDKQ